MNNLSQYRLRYTTKRFNNITKIYYQSFKINFLYSYHHRFDENKKLITYLEEYINFITNKYKRNKIIIHEITLNHTQISEFKKIYKINFLNNFLDFKVISSFKNINTNNTIYILNKICQK